MGKGKRKHTIASENAAAEKTGSSGTTSSKNTTEKKSIWSYWPIAVLVAILIFGTILRAYHLSYPVIGYHNWKETHYITEARNFAEHGFFTYGIFVPYSDLPYLDADPSGAHPDTFPMTSILVGIAFKIFGISLTVARVVNLLFGVATILAMYLAIKKLFKREDLALASAFITAILPLYLYFSHNVMLDNPGVFFMLMTVVFYVNWLDKNDTKNAIWTSIFLMLAILTKFSFAVIAVPMLFIFPWKRVLDIPKRWKTYLPCILILLLIPLWLWYANGVMAHKFGTGSVGGGLTSVNFKAAFDQQTWTALKGYAAENYGVLYNFLGMSIFRIGVFLTILGLILFIGFAIFKTKWSRGNRFITGYVVGTILWFFVMAEKLAGHSYHQYPIAPLFVFFMAFLFTIIAVNIETLVQVKYIRYIPLVIFCLLLLIPMMRAKNQLFDTQFIGLDVAGDYVRLHAGPTDTIFTSSEQSFGILWHADRKGFRPPSNMGNWTFGEQERNVQWIFAYQWGLQTFLGNPEYADYLANHYTLKQVGLLQQGQQFAPVYFLFQRGGTTNLSNIQGIIFNKPLLTQTYETSKGKIEMKFVNIE
jgi:4-amino-4-deoxy-L-arabinose transferase-like glycosyltransferase